MTVVLYENCKEMLSRMIESVISSTLSVKLYLVDNSPEPIFADGELDSSIDYRFLGENLGFGKAHNMVINELLTMRKLEVSETKYRLRNAKVCKTEGHMLECGQPKVNAKDAKSVKLEVGCGKAKKSNTQHRSTMSDSETHSNLRNHAISNSPISPNT